MHSRYKYIVVLLATLFGHVSHCQAQRLARDTIFKKIIPGTDRIDTCHYVYITHDASDDCYKQFEDVTDVEHTYKNYLTEKHLTKPRPRKDLADMPANWCSISFYKNKLYLYAPCDRYNWSVISIRNSVIVTGNQSDLRIDQNVSVEKISPVLYTVRYGTMYDIEGQHVFSPSGFNIHIVDTVNNIAVFENLYQGSHSPGYSLMIDMRHVRSLPAIVNYCACSKVNEVFQDERCPINFAETIKQNKLIFE